MKRRSSGKIPWKFYQKAKNDAISKMGHSKAKKKTCKTSMYTNKHMAWNAEGKYLMFSGIPKMMSFSVKGEIKKNNIPPEKLHPLEASSNGPKNKCLIWGGASTSGQFFAYPYPKVSLKKKPLDIVLDQLLKTWGDLFIFNVFRRVREVRSNFCPPPHLSVNRTGKIDISEKP